MTKKSFLISGILFILFMTVIFLFYRYTHPSFTTDYRPVSYTVSDRHLSNPYRGWYHIYGYTLSDTDSVNIDSVRTTAERDANEFVLLEINLRNYPASDISESGLSQLDSILSGWKSAKKQLILRFLYDWDGQAKETEPEEISIIKRHMTQTSQIVNQYKDYVFLMQGIYVGNWGEMHNSNFMSLENMCELAAYLDAVIDNDIFLSVRTPAFWRTICKTFEPLSADDAFSGTIAARTGLFNDGMLGSASDLGTYGNQSLANAAEFNYKGTRKDELLFQNTLCSYVPNGGEVVIDNSLNDFTNALADLKTMHISYLNCDYDKDVLDKWHSSTYTGADCFNGTDGYTYIGEHLGYRYAIKSSTLLYDTSSSDYGKLTLSIENSGFSCSYRPFVSTFTVLDENDDVIDTIPASSDSRFWKSGQTTDFSIPVDIHAYGAGSYQIYYSLKDPALDRNITLANNLDSAKYGYFIADLTINKK